MRQHYAPYNRSEESHRVNKRRMYCSLFLWDISLTLNMTYFYPLSSAAQAKWHGEPIGDCIALSVGRVFYIS